MSFAVLRTALASSMAVATFLGALAALVALNSGGEARVGPVPLMSLAAGHGRTAERLLAPPAPSEVDRRKAQAFSRAALRQFPYDVSSWLRLAYVDALDHGQLTPDGVALLRRSYDLVPVDIYVGVWRVRFALENSHALPRDLRAMVRNEVETLWQNPRRRAELKEMAATIRDPAGRLSAALWLNRLQRHVAE
jgi:hypothetical protein